MKELGLELTGQAWKWLLRGPLQQNVFLTGAQMQSCGLFQCGFVSAFIPNLKGGSYA